MANRRERFKKLYPKRLKNAKWNIRSIGKLSERTNYVYEEEEVDEILSTLMFEIKAAISKFGSGAVEERFKRYIDIDLKHMDSFVEIIEKMARMGRDERQDKRNNILIMIKEILIKSNDVEDNRSLYQRSL